MVLIYDKPVWFGSKLFVNGPVLNGLVSPIFKWLGLNGFINFNQFGLVRFGFYMNKWFGFKAPKPNRVEPEPGPLLLQGKNKTISKNVEGFGKINQKLRGISGNRGNSRRKNARGFSCLKEQRGSDRGETVEGRRRQ